MVRRTWIASLLLSLPLACRAGPDTILVVESYNVEMAWDAAYKKALEDTLGERYKLEYVQMDTKRLPKSQHPAMADQAWARYEQLKPALVVLGDDAALKYLCDRLGATSTPVVYLGINNNPREYFDNQRYRNITGVLERPNMKRNIALARRLLPNARRALVLFDTDVTSQVVRKETFGSQDSHDLSGIQVDLKLVTNWEDWQHEVLSAREKYDLIFIGLYQALHDREGRSVNTRDEVARWTSEHAPVPTFGFWDWAVGADKTAGGLVLYGYDQGKAAGDIALRILGGTPPSAIYPVTADRGRFFFSRKQLQRWGLKLPDDLAAGALLTD